MFLLQAKEDDEKNTEKSNDTSISEQLKVGSIVISSRILCCPLTNSTCFDLFFYKKHNELRHLSQTSLLVLQMLSTRLVITLA